MKKIKIKKSILIMLLILSCSSLTGCSKVIEAMFVLTPDEQKEIETLEEDNDNIIDYVKNNYTSENINVIYNEPMYNLAKDYIFEFEASKEAGYVSYKTVKVFDNLELERKNNCSYAEVKYNDGKITIKPSGALFLNEKGSCNINDGTWGSLNRLYLVQYIDLETGKDLETPIVTPFTINHGIDSPTIKQSVDENNNYVLSWDPVPGAIEYRIFEHFGTTGYDIECTTTQTSVSVSEFKTQKKSENYTNLVKQDLGISETDNDVVYMNRGVKYTDDFDGYFAVIAIDKDGNQSGISNIVDVRDISNKLPYEIVNPVYKKEINAIEDIPAYVDVKMIDGSIQQMLIDYHGAQTYKYADEPNKISIQARISNTLFDEFLIVMTGMNYDDVMSEISFVTKRQDILYKSGSNQEIDIKIPNSPSNNETKTDIEVGKKIKEMTPSNPNETTELNNAFKSLDLMGTSSQEVSNRLKRFNIEQINKVIYANTDLEAWIALNLITQMEIIPVPNKTFPEAANTEYLSDILMEAYRQNPCSGIISGIEYSYEYETLYVKYVEDKETRFEKAEAELQKSQEISNTIINNEMTDYEKVVAINNYLCDNAAYDYDSMSTDVDLTSYVPESFIDAHTPYGVLINNYGVCESYAEAFALIGRMSGLNVLMETGTLQGGAHEWNRVFVDGSWCMLDVTNNDLDLGKNSLLNVSNQQCASILIPDDTAYIKNEYHNSNDTTKEYYYNNKYYANDVQSAIDILEKQTKISNQASVRLPIGTSENEAIDILKKFIKETNIVPKDVMYFADVLSIELE